MVVVVIVVCVPGEPVGKGRPRVAVRGRNAVMYTPEKTAAYEALVRGEAERSMQGQALLAGPVELWLEIYTGIPASYPKRKAEAARAGHIVPTKKPDIDNVIKAVCDAFNGAVWVDDVQVVDLHVKRRFSDEPCILARVTPLDFAQLDLPPASD